MNIIKHTPAVTPIVTTVLLLVTVEQVGAVQRLVWDRLI